MRAGVADCLDQQHFTRLIPRPSRWTRTCRYRSALFIREVRIRSNGQDPPQVSSVQVRSAPRISDQALDGTARESPRIKHCAAGAQAGAHRDTTGRKTGSTSRPRNGRVVTRSASASRPTSRRTSGATAAPFLLPRPGPHTRPTRPHRDGLQRGPRRQLDQHRAQNTTLGHALPHFLRSHRMACPTSPTQSRHCVGRGVG
jgi:hypothetical protein